MAPTDVKGTCTAAIPPWAMKVIVPDSGKCPRNPEVYSGSGSQDLYTGNRSPITKARSVGLATGYFHGFFLLAHLMVTFFICLCFPIQQQEARHCEYLVASLIRGSVCDATHKHNSTHALNHWGSQLLLLESEGTPLMIWAWPSILLGTILQKIDILPFTFCIQPCMPPFNLLPQKENNLMCFSSSTRGEHSSKQPDIHRCWKCLVIQNGNKSPQPQWNPSPQHQPNTAWKYLFWSEKLSSTKWGQWPCSGFATMQNWPSSCFSTNLPVCGTM